MGEFIDKAKGAANEALGKAKGPLGQGCSMLITFLCS